MKFILWFCISSSLWANDYSQIIKELKEEAIQKGWTFQVNEKALSKMAPFENLGYKPAQKTGKERYIVPAMNEELPKTFDWRTQGLISAIKDQAKPQYCGSCWAFGTVAAFEAVIKWKTGKASDISEQQLVSCSNYGSCNGGDVALGFYTERGAAHEGDFQYRAANVQCKSNLPQNEKLSDWGYVGENKNGPTIEEMKRALVQYGPLVATVASSRSWGAYSGGIYNACDSQRVNHIIAIVGYDDAEGVWIVRNSHGTEWGEAGYMRSVYQDNQGRKCNALGKESAIAIW